MPTKKVILESRLKGANKTKQGLKGIDGGLKSLGKSAIGVAGAYFGAMGLIGAIKGAVDAFGQQELAEKKLEAALGRTSPALLDQAAALQKVTTYGDEATIEAMSLLAAFTDEEEQIKKLTPVILDLAAAKGMDLTAAADLVSKSVFSSTNALSRYGIEIKGAVGGTERLDSAVNNISALFGGQASAQAETMSGSVKQMSNAVGDAAEAFGELLAPTVVVVADGLKFIAESVSSVLDGFNKLGEETILLKLFSDAEMELQEFRKEVEGLSQESLIKLQDEMFKTKGPITHITDDAQLLNDKLKLLHIELTKVSDAFETYGIKADLAIQKSEGLGIEIEKVEQPVIKTGESTLSMGEKIVGYLTLNQDAIGTFGQFMTNTSNLLATAAGDDVKRQIQAMEIAQLGAIANTAREATKVLGNPFALGAVLAAGATQLIAIQNAIADAQSVKAAAFGANEIVSRPTLFLTGEAGPEHVQVTPLTAGMNQNGPQGGVTIQIQGNMIGNESFVRDTLIPEISKATNQGLA